MPIASALGMLEVSLVKPYGKVPSTPHSEGQIGLPSVELQEFNVLPELG